MFVGKLFRASEKRSVAKFIVRIVQGGYVKVGSSDIMSCVVFTYRRFLVADMLLPKSTVLSSSRDFAPKTSSS